MWERREVNYICIHISNNSIRPYFRKFKDTKQVISSCKSKDRQYNGQEKKDRQYNGQLKKDKGTNNDLQNTTQKTKD